MTNIPRSSVNVTQLQSDGQIKLTEEHGEGEAAKIGTLRGGSSGCITSSGTILGKCPRLSHLRSLGIQENHDNATYLMFAAGYSNEDIWYECLTRSWNGVVLREEEMPVSWATTNGTSVSGRPDIVLCSLADDGTRLEPVPQLGLELKLVSSPFTAYNVAAKDMPTLDHVIQASHYMWQLNIPYKLLYTSRSNYGLGFPNMKPTWLTAPQFLHDEQFKTLPFIVEFDLWIENNVVWYQGRTRAVKTNITTEGIKEYYERVSQMGERRALGPRPDSRNADGTVRSWKACEPKYCTLSETCDLYETNYELWLDHAKLKLTKEQ